MYDLSIVCLVITAKRDVIYVCMMSYQKQWSIKAIDHSFICSLSIVAKLRVMLEYAIMPIQLWIALSKTELDICQDQTLQKLILWLLG